MENVIAKFAHSEIITLKQIARRWTDEPDPLWRLSLLLDAAEFLIKIHAAYALELFRVHDLHESQRDHYDGMRARLRMPTIGDWANACRVAAAQLGRLNSPDARAFCEVESTIREARERLVILRNERAHGATPTRDQAQGWLESHAEALMSVASPFVGEECYAVDYLPHVSDPLQSPAWAKVILRNAKRSVELFPWCVARLAKDAVTAILLFNRCDKGIDYLDHGSGENRSLTQDESSQMRAFASEALRRRIKVLGMPVSFESLIAELAYCFAGREKELESINGFVSAEKPSASTLLIIGDPGIGKSALAAKIVRDLQPNPKPIHHFCRRGDDSTLVSTALIHNVLRQVRLRLPADYTSEDCIDALVFLGATLPKPAVVVLDGLDEMEPAELEKTLLSVNSVVKKTNKVRWILLGQPQVEDAVRRLLLPEVLPLSGLNAREIQEVADYFELRHSEWNLKDSRNLATVTEGLPLYVVSVLREVAEGALDRKAITTLPSSVQQYWSRAIRRSMSRLSSASRRDAGAITAVCSRALLNIHSDANRAELVPHFKNLASALRSELHRLGSNDRPLLVICLLAVSPLPLTQSNLCAMSGLSQEDTVKQLDAYEGFLVQTGSGPVFQVYHNSLCQFLRAAFPAAVLEAEVAFLKWASRWTDSETQRRAYPFLLLREWRRTKGAERIARAMSKLITSWQFFVAQLRASEVAPFVAMCQEFTAPESKSAERIRDSLEGDSGAWHAEDGGKRVLSEWEERRRLEREKWQLERALRDVSNPDEDEDPLDGDIVARMEADQKATEDRLRASLPAHYFFAWGNTEKTLKEIHLAYNRASDGLAPLSNVSPLLKGISRIETLLTANHLALTRALHEDDSEQAIAAVVERSHLLSGTAFYRRAKAILDANVHPRLLPQSGCRPSVFPERAFILQNRSFCFTTEASLLFFRLDGFDWRKTNREHTRLCVFDWLRSTTSIVLLPGDVAPVAAARDGSRLLLEHFSKKGDTRPHTYHLAHTASYKPHEVNGSLNAKLVSVTPDLKFALFAAKSVVLVNLETNRVVGSRTLNESDHYVRSGRLTGDGAFAVLLYDGPRSYFLWDPRTGQHEGIGDVTSSPSNYREKDTFALSPNGRLIFAEGKVFDISQNDLVRRFRDRTHLDDEAPAIFSSDSRILVVGNASQDICIFDVQNGCQIGSLKCREAAQDIALSADARFAFIKTTQDNFAVVDLIASTVTDHAGPVVTQREMEGLVTAPHLKEMAFHDADENLFRIATPPRKRVRVLDDRSSSLDGTQLLGAYVTSDRIWVIRQPLVLFELSKRSGRILSQTMLLKTPRLEAKAVFRGCGRVRNEWAFGVACDPVALSETELAIAIYPDVLMTIDLKGRMAHRWTKLKGFEVQRLTSSEGVIYATSSRGEVVAWDFGRGSVRRRALPLDSLYSFSVIHVPSLKALAAFNEGQFLGMLSLPKLDFIQAERKHRSDSLCEGIHLVGRGPLLLGGCPQPDSNYTTPIGLCLFDLTNETYLSQLTFESPIRHISKFGPNEFSVHFEDGRITLVHAATPLPRR